MTADTKRLQSNETNPVAQNFVINQLAERIARGLLTDMNISGAAEDTSPDGAADYIPSYDASAGINKKILLHRATAYKVGSFTYDISTATGTQAVTGVGFRPKAVVFIASEGGGAFPINSIGVDDGTSHGDISTASGSVFLTKTTHSIAVGSSGPDFQLASISSLGSDGFTLSWVKTGTPTGTATVIYLALR